jgi:hypothetical protein
MCLDTQRCQMPSTVELLKIADLATSNTPDIHRGVCHGTMVLATEC